MTDLARLSISVDTRSLRAAEERLRLLPGAAEAAESSLSRLAALTFGDRTAAIRSETAALAALARTLRGIAPDAAWTAAWTRANAPLTRTRADLAALNATSLARLRAQAQGAGRAFETLAVQANAARAAALTLSDLPAVPRVPVPTAPAAPARPAPAALLAAPLLAPTRAPAPAVGLNESVARTAVLTESFERLSRARPLAGVSADARAAVTALAQVEARATRAAASLDALARGRTGERAGAVDLRAAAYGRLAASLREAASAGAGWNANLPNPAVLPRIPRAMAAAAPALAAGTSAGAAAPVPRGTDAGLDRLVRQVDPAARATHRLAEAQGVLDDALSRGAVSAGRHAELISRTRAAYAGALDPMGQFNARLEAEAAAAARGSRARADVIAGLNAEARLRRQGAVLTEAEAAAVRGRVIAVREAVREADMAQRAAAGSADMMAASYQGLAAAAITVVTALAARKVYDYAEAWTAANNTVRRYTQGAGEQAAVMDELFRLAQDTRQEFGGITETYGRIAISADALGASQADLVSATGAAAASLAIMGSSGPGASEAMRQFGQALGSPVVQAEEFNSLMDAMTPLMAQVAQHVLGAGATIADLKNYVNNQKLSGTNFFQAVLAASQTMQEQLRTAVPSMAQGFTALDNALGKYVGEANEAAGVSTALARGMIDLSENIDVAAASAAGLVASGLVLFLPAVARGIQAVTLAMARNPFGALAVAAAGVGTALTVLRDEIVLTERAVGENFESIPVTVGDAMRAVGSYLSDAERALGDWQEAAFGAADSQGHALGQTQSEWEKFAGFTRNLINDEIGKFHFLAGTIPQLFMGIPDALGDLIAQAMNAMIRQVEQGTNRLIGIMNTIPKALSLPTLPSVELPRMENPYAGAAAGVASMVRGQWDASFNHDFVGDIKKRAEQASIERRAGQRPPGEGVDLTTSKPPAGAPADTEKAAASAKKAADAAEASARRLADALQSLQDRLDPVGRAQRELAEGTGVLDAALARGAIGAGEHARLVGALGASLRDALDPMAAYATAAAEEARMARMDADARTDLSAAMADEQRLRQQGVAFTDASAAAFRAEVIARIAANRAAEESLSAAQSSAGALAEEVARQREHNAAIGLSEAVQTELNRVRQQGLLITDEAALAAERAAHGETALAKALSEAIERRRELIDLQGSGARLEAEAAAARAAEEDWKRTAETIEQSLTDALMRGFESGKGFGENLRDTLKNMFATLVLKPIIEPAMQEFSQSVTGMLRGGLGRTSSVPGAAAGGGAGGGFGALGNLGSLASLFGGGGSLAGAAYGALMPGMAAGSQQAAMLAAQTGGFGASGLSATFGSAGGGAGFLGGSGGALAAGAGYMGGAYVGTKIGASIGGYDKNQADYASAGAAIGSIFGPVGGLIGGALGGVLGGFMDPGDAERRGTFRQGQPGAAPTYSGKSALGEFGITNDRWFSDQEMGGAFRSFLDGLKAMDDQLAASLSRDELGRVKERLMGLSREVGFGMEHTDVSQSGAFGGLALERYQAAFQAINPPLARFLERFQGTGDELAAMVGSLTALNAAMKAGRVEIQEQKTAWEQWQDLIGQTRAELAGFDDSLESLQEIVGLNQRRYAMEAELIRGITDTIATQQANFEASVRDIRYGAMDDTGKATYLRDEANASFAELASAVDPERIRALGDELRGLIQQSHQLVGPESQRELSEYFVADLQRVSQLVADRLGAAREAVRDASDPDAPGSLAAAIEAALTRSSGGFQKGADLLQQAAITMLAAAQTPVTVRVQTVRAGSEVGG